jgi:hypothetical protein
MCKTEAGIDFAYDKGIVSVQSVEMTKRTMFLETTGATA